MSYENVCVRCRRPLRYGGCTCTVFTAPEREASPPPSENLALTYQPLTNCPHCGGGLTKAAAARSSGQTTPTQDAERREAAEDCEAIARFLDNVDCTCPDPDGEYPCWYHKTAPERVAMVARVLDEERWTRLAAVLRAEHAEQSPVSPPAATTRAQQTDLASPAAPQQSEAEGPSRGGWFDYGLPTDVPFFGRDVDMRYVEHLRGILGLQRGLSLTKAIHDLKRVADGKMGTLTDDAERQRLALADFTNWFVKGYPPRCIIGDPWHAPKLFRAAMYSASRAGLIADQPRPKDAKTEPLPPSATPAPAETPTPPGRPTETLNGELIVVDFEPEHSPGKILLTFEVPVADIGDWQFGPSDWRLVRLDKSTMSSGQRPPNSGQKTGGGE